MTDTLLQDLQNDIADRIRADAVLGGIPIVTERAGDVLSEISRAIGLVETSAGGTGLCIVVMQITGQAEASDLPEPFLQLEPAIRVLEHPVLNSTGRTGLEIARRIIRLFWHYQPVTMASAFTPGTPLLVPVADPVAPVAYDIVFQCHEAEKERSIKAASPDITATSATVPTTVTLTCATAGADVWYTLDGSHPRPGNAPSFLYSAPFEIAYASRLRASAFKSDCIASDVNAFHFD